MALLEIKNLKMDFGKGADALRAVDDVSLTIGAGGNRLPCRRERLRQKRHRPFHRAAGGDTPANYTGGESC